METHQDVALLKESFLEFITKVSPVLNEAILEQFNTKWLPFKKLLCDPQKNASDIFIFVSSMSSLKKSNASSTSTNSPYSESSSNKKVELETKLKTEPSEQREYTKVKEQANPLHSKELRIEINKNFFINTPRSGPPSQQDLNNPKSNKYEHDIKAKILRDDIKFLNELRNATPKKKQSFTERCQISVKISEAVFQFRKNNNTLKTIHERSCEVNTPQSPKQGRSESPILVVHRPNPNNYFFNPITYQINQQGALKGYSIYSKKIIQPMQFDTQFQMMIQQYQNNIIYKKLYF